MCAVSCRSFLRLLNEFAHSFSIANGWNKPGVQFSGELEVL